MPTRQKPTTDRHNPEMCRLTDGDVSDFDFGWSRGEYRSSPSRTQSFRVAAHPDVEVRVAVLSAYNGSGFRQVAADGDWVAILEAADEEGVALAHLHNSWSEGAANFYESHQAKMAAERALKPDRDIEFGEWFEWDTDLGNAAAARQTQ